MGNIQTAGPNEALIVSGGCCRPSRKQIIVGGWCWNTWMLTNIQTISLQVMTLNPKCEHVQSCHGVPVTVTGVVHCKIMSTPEFLPLAAEQFLGKSVEHIKSVILHTVEGHMRAAIGTQPIEDICKKREEFASLIREHATKDLSRMGIDIMSLTIKDIRDDVEYLSSAGKKTTARVKRTAAISAAVAESAATIKEDEYKKDKEESEYKYKTMIAKQQHEIEMAKASRNEEVGRLKAEAMKAYDLQLATLNKNIRTTEMEVKASELEGLIKIQEKENERRKTEMEINIDLPTKSEIHELTKQTEAILARVKAETEAEEHRIKTEGEARAKAFLKEGVAEADGMKLVAKARKEFNDAAQLFEVLKVLPEVAAEVASPLSKFDEIVLISDQSHTDPKTAAAQSAKLMSALPYSMRAIGGDQSILGSLLQLQRFAKPEQV